MSTIYKLRDGYGVCVGGRFDGWLMRKHPDGQWVSVEKLELEAPKVPAFLQTAKPAGEWPRTKKAPQEVYEFVAKQQELREGHKALQDQFINQHFPKRGDANDPRTSRPEDVTSPGVTARASDSGLVERLRHRAELLRYNWSEQAPYAATKLYEEAAALIEQQAAEIRRLTERASNLEKVMKGLIKERNEWREACIAHGDKAEASEARNKELREESIKAEAALAASEARVKELRGVLEAARVKLKLYRAQHSGEYIGGMPYPDLMDAIRAVLTAKEGVG